MDRRPDGRRVEHRTLVNAVIGVREVCRVISRAVSYVARRCAEPIAEHRRHVRVGAEPGPLRHC